MRYGRAVPVLGVVGVLFGSLAVPSPRAQTPAPNVLELYKKNCTTCHLETGAPTKTGQMLNSPDLSSEKVTASPVDSLVRVITEGRGKMKGFKGKLTDAEIKALAEYVKAMSKKPEAKP